MSDTAEGYKNDTAEANAWVEKTLATKKLKAARMPMAGGLTTGK